MRFWSKRECGLVLAGLILLLLVACGTTATGMPAGTSPASTSQAEATALHSFYAGLLQAKTPEGYYVLGRSDAPITMQFYSDFL